ncbi:unnamed protein product, partial [Symbiodinium sp. KB8]
MFSHPPLPKEKQARLEQPRASFTQRVSEARAQAAGPKKRSAETPETPDLGTIPEQQRENEEHEQLMQVHYGTLATLRLAARERRQGLVRSAREHVALAVAKAGLPDSANLTESECSNTTEWWRSRVRSAQTIEEISRLQVNFRKMKQLQEESCINISSGSEEEWAEDSEARVEYFRRKVLKMFDEENRVATSSGVGSAERGESSSPTVDILVSPTAEYVGHWSPATDSEVTPGAEIIPETPPPAGMVGPGVAGPVPAKAAKASDQAPAREVLEKAAARELLESLVREQERQDREGPQKFSPKFLAPTPKVAKPKP